MSDHYCEPGGCSECWVQAKDAEQAESLEPLVVRLRKRAKIRRQITTRKSVQEGKPDRIADLLDEAADHIFMLYWAHVYTSQVNFKLMRRDGLQ